MRHRGLILAALAATALGAAGCGSSSSTGSSGSAASSSTPTQTTGTTSASSAAAGGSPTPCASATFGSPLAPKDPPSDVHKYAAAPATQINPAKLYEATISTAKGDIVLCLEPSLAPNTVNNFVVLARNHFYDGLTFHRVVSGFVVQGGDPSGNGSGGPGYQFNDEKVTGAYTAGCVAMANAGPNTNGSQFFICSADDSQQLQPLYNLFGYVQSGFDVVLQIAQGDVMQSVTVRESN